MEDGVCGGDLRMCDIFNDKIHSIDGDRYFAGDYNSEISRDCFNRYNCLSFGKLFPESRRSQTDFWLCEENFVPKREINDIMKKVNRIMELGCGD